MWIPEPAGDDRADHRPDTGCRGNDSVGVGIGVQVGDALIDLLDLAGQKQRLLGLVGDVLSEFDIGIAPRLRMKDGAPVRTDSGNLIYDAACGRIEEPAALAAALKSVTGVVEHGLFLDLADKALIGGEGGVTVLEP